MEKEFIELSGRDDFGSPHNRIGYGHKALSSKAI